MGTPRASSAASERQSARRREAPSQGGPGAAQLGAWQGAGQRPRLCSHRQANFTHRADPRGQTDAGLFVFLGSPCLKS